jgi:hypothetical protein
MAMQHTTVEIVADYLKEQKKVLSSEEYDNLYDRVKNTILENKRSISAEHGYEYQLEKLMLKELNKELNKSNETSKVVVKDTSKVVDKQEEFGYAVCKFIEDLKEKKCKLKDIPKTFLSSDKIMIEIIENTSESEVSNKEFFKILNTNQKENSEILKSLNNYRQKDNIIDLQF